MVGLAPRALGNCAPSALSAVVVRPLNFTVRHPAWNRSRTVVVQSRACGNLEP